VTRRFGGAGLRRPDMRGGDQIAIGSSPPSPPTIESLWAQYGDDALFWFDASGLDVDGQTWTDRVIGLVAEPYGGDYDCTLSLSAIAGVDAVVVAPTGDLGGSAYVFDAAPSGLSRHGHWLSLVSGFVEGAGYTADAAALLRSVVCSDGGLFISQVPADEVTHTRSGIVSPGPHVLLSTYVGTAAGHVARRNGADFPDTGDSAGSIGNDAVPELDVVFVAPSSVGTCALFCGFPAAWPHAAAFESAMLEIAGIT